MKASTQHEMITKITQKNFHTWFKREFAKRRGNLKEFAEPLSFSHYMLERYKRNVNNIPIDRMMEVTRRMKEMPLLEEGEKKRRGGGAKAHSEDTVKENNEWKEKIRKELKRKKIPTRQLEYETGIKTSTLEGYLNMNKRIKVGQCQRDNIEKAIKKPAFIEVIKDYDYESLAKLLPKYAHWFSYKSVGKWKSETNPSAPSCEDLYREIVEAVRRDKIKNKKFVKLKATKEVDIELEATKAIQKELDKSNKKDKLTLREKLKIALRIIRS